nr:MAG TPA: hypothetical protein [Caudoviricetes sp.]
MLLLRRKMAKFNEQAYKNAFNKEKYEQLTIRLPHGSRDQIKEKAAAKGLSMAAYIWQLVENDK